MNTTKNKYYFEALDNYPYNLPDCAEALNYALSYDPEDADCLCLMGRMYSEIIKNYEEAKTYFEQAMQYDVTNVNTPQFYINCLLNNGDLEEAKKLIDYSLKIKGIDMSVILYLKSVYFEKKNDFKKALKQIKKAKEFSFNETMTNFLNGRKSFIKKKMSKKK